MRCPAAQCLSRLLPAALAGAAAIAPLLAQVPAPAAPRAPQPPFDRLLVANKAEHTLSIFDPAEKRELARLPTGAGPHEVAVAPSGRLAVVTEERAARVRLQVLVGLKLFAGFGILTIRHDQCSFVQIHLNSRPSHGQDPMWLGFGFRSPRFLHPGSAGGQAIPGTLLEGRLGHPASRSRDEEK